MKTISSNGNITMVRGDTVRFSLFINKGTLLSPDRYYVKSTDKIYVGIMEENQSFERAIIRKVYDGNSAKNKDGDLIIEISPIDTENLLSGAYLYTVKFQSDGNIVETLIPERQFTLIG